MNAFSMARVSIASRAAALRAWALRLRCSLISWASQKAAQAALSLVVSRWPLTGCCGGREGLTGCWWLGIGEGSARAV